MTPPTRPQADAIGEISNRMDVQFGELKGLLSEIGERVRAMEMREAGCSPLMGSKLDAAFRKLDDHESRIKGMDAEIRMLNQTIGELRQTNKLLSWLGGLMGSAIILYIVNSLLHLL